MTIERFPVEETHILFFARAIGDYNPRYTDPSAPGGIVAPPTFAMAGSQFDPDNPLRPKPDEPWFGSGRKPSGAKRESGGVLHAEQSFEYHKPLRPGMMLTTRERDGDTWEKAGRRGGKLVFKERIVDYVEAGSGDVVVTARMVSVLTERPAEPAPTMDGSGR
ncbi:MAG TPA: MaoC family dehydratase N-terminal domain-containing protein [Acidimicrobiales bacterium]|nr:MaoC family dehydratase N-terminal domain-containing protein [Acidimicrobiales bacterium]